MDTSKLCRSCMKEVASWEKENFNIRAVEMFCFCTNVKITEDDKLPKQFCYDCVIKIESSFTYITKAQKVDALLKNIISTVEPKFKKTNDLKLTLPDYKVSPAIDNEFGKNERVNVAVDTGQDAKHEEKTIDASVKEEERQTKGVTVSATEINIVKTRKHVCPMCRKEFTSKLWFNKHMDKEHNGPKFVCEHCQKTFSKQWEFKQHSACHTEERKYSCAECGKCFKRRQQLRMHARTHADLRPFECDKCGMKFKFKSVLKTHLRLHEGDKPFLCYFCGSSFAQAGNLKVHMRKHTGAKPYSCSECNFRAAVASTLKRHQRRHRLDRVYVCQLCHKGFYDASGLVRHSRIHSGELPFQCPECSRAFADSWKRKTHLMRAHRFALSDIPPMRRNGQTYIR